MTDYNTSLDLVARLVKQFHTNRAAYHAPNYKEAHARQDLIDPLFIALGWDVHNEERAAPQYREVILEDSLEIEGEDARKAPDYAFRIGETRKFFAEAKKPGVALKTAAAPAYQLRRYAWSAKLPFSLLTDFEELAVYDCRSRPSEKHKASVGRHNFYTFEEYPDRWREIWDVFSREAVWGGSFDQFIQAGKGRGTSEVDAEFLREIEGWRDVLARNMALRNPQLGIDDLNDAVQRTIDRVIFLRMAEDRGIEPYEQLCRLAEKDGVYGELIDLCGKADARYNAGLFDLSPRGDPITPKLSVDDKVLKPIITGLYFPQSPYEFSVLPIQVLGNIYEQFLGQVIRLTAAHQAKVEPKPEVRKAGGVFYTPTYIVDYIVKNTVGKLVEGKAPKQLAGDPKGSPFRALDMACGSGSFLLGVYQLLLDYYLRWYVGHNPDKHPNAVWQRGEEWRLTIAEKKRILTTHIFGVDIDRQAVEVTKLSLLLKVLEGESTETLQMALPGFQERALPNLDNNIKCGNSLIGHDYFTGQLLRDTDELRRVNPFDWEHEFPDAVKAGGFDCVVGNPPYVLLQDQFRNDPQLAYFRSKYVVAAYKVDTYHLFIERGIRLTKPNGYCSMITPANFLTNNYMVGMRRFLLEKSCIDHIVVIDGGVFDGISVDNAIFVVSAGQSTSKTFPIIHEMPKGNLLEEKSRTVISVPRALQDEHALFTGTTDKTSNILWRRVSERSKTLGEIANVNFGKQLRDRKKFPKDVIEVTSPKNIPRHYRPCYTGRDVSRYYLHWGNLACLDDDVARCGGCWDEGIQNAKDKLVTRQIGRYPEFGIDSVGYQCLNTMFMVGLFAEDLDPRFVLGILNSKLIRALWLDRFYDQRRTFPKIKGTYLKQLPVYAINFSDPADVAHYDRMVTLVEQMLELHKRVAAARSQSDQELYQRQIDATDKEIDKLVYNLYGLTEEEIRIVEEEAR